MATGLLGHTNSLSHICLQSVTVKYLFDHAVAVTMNQDFWGSLFTPMPLSCLLSPIRGSLGRLGCRDKTQGSQLRSVAVTWELTCRTMTVTLTGL